VIIIIIIAHALIDHGLNALAGINHFLGIHGLSY
jgi:hypothetical protein